MDDTTEIMGLVNGKSEKALTHKQEEFCRLVVQGESLSQAYRQSHHPPNMQKKTVYEKASRLGAMGKIGARIAELQAPAVKKAQRSYEQWLRQVEEVAFVPPEQLEVKTPDMLKALELFGKATGIYQEKMATPMSALEQLPTAELVFMLAELKARKAAREAKTIEAPHAEQS